MKEWKQAEMKSKERERGWRTRMEAQAVAYTLILNFTGSHEERVFWMKQKSHIRSTPRIKL